MKLIFKFSILVFIVFSCKKTKVMSIHEAIKFHYDSNNKELGYSDYEILDSSIVDRFFLDTILINSYNSVITLNNKKIDIYRNALKQNASDEFAFGNANVNIDTLDIKNQILSSEIIISETEKKIEKIISISPGSDPLTKFVLVNYIIIPREGENILETNFIMLLSSNLKTLFYSNDPNI